LLIIDCVFVVHFGFLQSGVVIAIIAHGLIGISLVWDKVLLTQPETRNLLSYVFWLGAISIFGLVLIPFGFRLPSFGTIGIAFSAGALQLVAVYFYYAALKAGEASQTLAIMGGFSPAATALISLPLLQNPFGKTNFAAFSLMVIGGFLMFLSEKVNVRKVLPAVLIASGAFGMVNVMQKLVFNRTNFVSGYVFFTIGTFVGALALLIPADWREQILEESERAELRSRFWYFVNRFVSGVGSFLVYYAVSLTSPALVDAITGLRYVIIFLGAYLLTRVRPDWLCEQFAGRVVMVKAVATLLIVVGLVWVGLDGTHRVGSGVARNECYGWPLQRQESHTYCDQRNG
jgi:drug/metabolite transporter (DMT)-like permease